MCLGTFLTCILLGFEDCIFLSDHISTSISESFNSNLAHERNFVFWQCRKFLCPPSPVLTVPMILRLEVIAEAHGDKHEILYNYSDWYVA